MQIHVIVRKGFTDERKEADDQDGIGDTKADKGLESFWLERRGTDLRTTR